MELPVQLSGEGLTVQRLERKRVFLPARAQIAIALATIACCCTAISGCKTAPAQAAPIAKPAPRIDNSPAGQLRAIGDRVVASVLGKDTSALLEYDHNSEDQLSLSDRATTNARSTIYFQPLPNLALTLP
jgi:hypothetical protein